MTIFSQRDVGPAFVLHINLLAQLIEHFYRALERERQLETAMRMEAIHQTGSRLTHDIKNLLQSMEYLAAVVQAAGPDQAQESLALLQKQFPELRNRLQLTLEKLKAPEQKPDAARGISALDWWAKLRKRYADGRITFEDELDGDAEIPKELFDNVAENLLENASFKQVINRDISITARLEIDAGRAMLEVHDSGEKVPPEIARGLFREAVSSKQGLGVGLYQSHRLAQTQGYALGLISNRDGDVGFLLEPNV
jgi:nitrogen-specific signal transduction histidine kinase